MFSRSLTTWMKNALVVALSALTLWGCGSDDDKNKGDTSSSSGSDTSGATSGADTSGGTSGTTENDTSGATSGADTSGGGEDTSGGGITYTASVQPIYQEKCTPCHTSAAGCSGGVCFGAVYADTQNPSNVCAGLTVGECTLQRILAGSMPLGGGCTGDPTQDAANSGCLTADQQQTIQDWIDAGMPE